MKLRVVGNALVVGIPKKLAEAMGWEAGNKLQIEVDQCICPPLQKVAARMRSWRFSGTSIDLEVEIFRRIQPVGPLPRRDREGPEAVD